ncbi:MAG TPA: DnaJ C-terminal domain-containing protein [Afifellaceae bacterium]|nr:DnaJ C-terminal domain-containing protein [Afifellaceae bacterium]
MRDPYDVLGVDRSAGAAEIKRAYRKLAKESHPDRHKGDVRAKDRFAEINAAYEVIGDKDKRARFDRGEIDADGNPRFQGFEGFSGQGPGGFGGGFENIDPRIFSDIFSSFGGGRQGGAPGGGARTFRFSTGGGQAGGGDDILRSIFGGARPRQDRTGKKPLRGADVKAEIAVTLEDIAAGKKPSAKLPTGKTVALSLPKGVSDGQVIRLKGQGQPSPTGGTGGDALVTVRFVPHPQFSVSGADLRVEVPVPLADAVLGAKVAVPTLAGRVQVSVPAMADTGKAMRLKGKGLPKKGGHGDLIVDLKITLPDKPDADLDALMKRWREAGAATKSK